VTKGGGRLF